MASWTSPKTWADAIALTAAELNTYLRDNLQYLYDRLGTQSAILSSDVTKSSASFSDITGLSFTVANGKNYNFRAFLTYESTATTLVPQFGFNHPGGGVRAMVTVAGDTTSTSLERDWVTATDTSAITTTPNATGTAYGVWIEGRYICTASGTFALRFARLVTGTLTVHKSSSLTVTSD